MKEKKLVKAPFKRERISAITLETEKELLLSDSSENCPVPCSTRDVEHN